MDAAELADTLSKLGYAKLNPMQTGAVAAGLLDSGSFLVSAPTASGKTLLALLKIAAARNNGPAVYIVPLKALATEKKDEFTAALSSFGLSVAVATGDLDYSGDELAAYDVVIVTSEKMDSLLRHTTPWTKKIALAIIDEMHLMGDAYRGATLEVVITKLKEQGCEILGLSATIPNAPELSEWLGARFFESDYRPTLLDKRIACENVLYSDEGTDELGAKPLDDLVSRALAENKGKGQALVFVASRRSTESVAKELCKITKKVLTPEEQLECDRLSRKALKALSVPTEQCKSLAYCLANGVSFHHAGLVAKDRELIEEGFKKLRCIKVIVATTTLAMGVDFPASWVIVRDTRRFDGDYSNHIPNLEVQQMLGRAGRPRFDKKGIGVVCCSRRDLRTVRDKYILGPLEHIYSQLSAEPALRTHCLSLVASGHAKSFEELKAFFGRTFYGKQYGDLNEIFGKIDSIAMQLGEMGFVAEKNGKLFASPLGKRTSELYLDPLTAHSIINRIKSPKPTKLSPEFSWLLEYGNAVESRPLPRVGKQEEQSVWDDVYANLDDASLGEWEMDREALEKWKNAKIINAWINEATEDDMLKTFDLPPGVIHARMRIVEWLTYSTSELAMVLNAASARIEARKLQRRVKHGVKEELLNLVGVRGIGRVRARRLWNAGVKDREALRSVDKAKLAGIIGEKTAERILAQYSSA